VIGIHVYPSGLDIKTAYRCLAGLPRNGYWEDYFQNDSILEGLHNTGYRGCITESRYFLNIQTPSNIDIQTIRPEKTMVKARIHETHPIFCF